MSGMDQIIREDARLIVLKALSEQTDERLNSSVLLEIIETYGGIRKTREWLHGELDWLAEMGAVKLTSAGVGQDRHPDRKGRPPSGTPHRHRGRQASLSSGGVIHGNRARPSFQL